MRHLLDATATSSSGIGSLGTLALPFLPPPPPPPRVTPCDILLKASAAIRRLSHPRSLSVCVPAGKRAQFQVLNLKDMLVRLLVVVLAL